MTIYSGFSHEKWWFSIAMLVYQRVTDVVTGFWQKNPNLLSFISSHVGVNHFPQIQDGSKIHWRWRQLKNVPKNGASMDPWSLACWVLKHLETMQFDDCKRRLQSHSKGSSEHDLTNLKILKLLEEPGQKNHCIPKQVHPPPDSSSNYPIILNRIKSNNFI